MPRKKAARKTKTAKKTSVKTPEVKADVLDNAESVKVSSNKLSFGLSKTQKIILIVIIVLGLTAYFLKDLFIVAMVNGAPISRIAVIKELEARGGKQTVDSIITETLIKQEAQKAGLSVSQEEIDEELGKIEEDLQAQGQTLDQVLEMQGMTKDDAVSQIRIQKLLEKILGDKIQVTDQEVDDYIKNSGTYDEGQQVADQERDQIKEQLKQQKLSQEFNNWLSQVKSQANITYFLQY